MKRKKELTWFQRHILCDIQTYCVLHTEFEKYYPCELLGIKTIVSDIEDIGGACFEILTSIYPNDRGENIATFDVIIGFDGKTKVFFVWAGYDNIEEVRNK